MRRRVLVVDLSDTPVRDNFTPAKILQDRHATTCYSSATALGVTAAVTGCSHSSVYKKRVFPNRIDAFRYSLQQYQD